MNQRATHTNVRTRTHALFLSAKTGAPGGAPERADATLHLDGPYPASEDASLSVESAGRMEHVTLPPLKRAGFHKFAWSCPTSCPAATPSTTTSR